MRVLVSSTRGAGHFAPLVPFAGACLRAGHEVLVAGPPDLEDSVAAAGFDYWPFDPPPDEELGPVWGRVPSLPPDEANQVVIGEIFGRLNATAALPRLSEACQSWRPDVVLREMAEFGSAIAAERHGLPHARVAAGLASTEAMSLGMAAEAVDDVRREAGLPPDPEAEALRRSPFLSMFPAAIETGPPQPRTLRFADPGWRDTPAELSDWWDGRGGPLVYVSFGSVAGGLEMAGGAYQAAIEAMAEVDVRVLLTVGRAADMTAFESAPPNVHVEPWVPQADVLAHAAAVICHGGSGTTLGALAAGRPLVVVPLFADQPENARGVAGAGAGLVAEPRVDQIRDAVQELLGESRFAEAAAAVAAEMASHPPVDEAAAELERLAGRASA